MKFALFLACRELLHIQVKDLKNNLSLELSHLEDKLLFLHLRLLALFTCVYNVDDVFQDFSSYVCQCSCAYGVAACSSFS